MSRIVYAIADDGLIFKGLAKINERTRTPVRATFLSGFYCGVVALLFTTDQLVDMTSLGTLMAYTMVAVCILILRYEDPQMENVGSKESLNFGRQAISKVLNVPVTFSEPNELTSNIVKACTFLALILSFAMGSIVAFFAESLTEPAVMVAAVLLALALLTIVIVIGRQPQSTAKLSFKVQPVPYLPIVCIFFNVYLMLKINHATWLRFLGWLIIGLIIYFSYGIWHSKQSLEQKSTRHHEKRKVEVV